MKLCIPKHIEAITPYPPGTPQDEVERRYGVKNPIKLASNENPYSPSSAVIEAITQILPKLNRYPDGASYSLSVAIAEKFGVEQSEVVLGNGSDDLIDCLIRAFIESDSEVISSQPSFLMYSKGVQIAGGVNKIIPLDNMHHNLAAIRSAVTEKSRLIFLDNPNNPTGSVIPLNDLYAFIGDMPEHVVIVIDEAYVDFMDETYRPDVISLIRNTKSKAAVVFLRTFSKAYGLPGLRLGYGLMDKEIASLLHKVRQPFNVNTLAQIAGEAALHDDAGYAETLTSIHKGIGFLQKGLTKLGCTVYPTQTNFILFDTGRNADALYEAMLYKGVITRSMSPYNLPQCMRITCGTDDENTCFLEAFSQTLAELENK